MCSLMQVWMPSLRRFVEVSSISNCRDYQVRAHHRLLLFASSFSFVTESLLLLGPLIFVL